MKSPNYLFQRLQVLYLCFGFDADMIHIRLYVLSSLVRKNPNYDSLENFLEVFNPCGTRVYCGSPGTLFTAASGFDAPASFTW